MTTAEAFTAFLTPPRIRELDRDVDLREEAQTTRVRLPANGYARGNNEEIAVYTWGEGAPVLLVHGWGSRATHLEAFIRPLVAAGRKAVSFDAPAHGHSEGSLASAPAVAAAIGRVAAMHGGTFQAIIAHSLGAVAATQALSQRSVAASKVVTLGACCRVEPVLAQFAVKAGLDDSAREALIRFAAAAYLPNEVSADLLAPGLHGISALLMHDPADPEMPYTHSSSLSAAWPGSVLVETPGVGHFRILRSREVVKRTLDHILSSTR